MNAAPKARFTGFTLHFVPHFTRSALMAYKLIQYHLTSLTTRTCCLGLPPSRTAIHPLSSMPPTTGTSFQVPPRVCSRTDCHLLSRIGKVQPFTGKMVGSISGSMRIFQLTQMSWLSRLIVSGPTICIQQQVILDRTEGIQFPRAQ